MTEPTAATPAEGQPFDGRTWVPRSVRQSYAQRPVALRRAAVSEWYARFYAPLAVVGSALGLMPLYDRPLVIGDRLVPVNLHGNLLQTAMTYDDGSSEVGLVLLASLVGLLIRACIRVSTPAIPLIMASLAAVALCLLLLFHFHPQTRMVLSSAGMGAVAVVIWVLVLGVVHAVHLLRITDEPTD